MNLDRLRDGKMSMKCREGGSDTETKRYGSWWWSKGWDPGREEGCKVRSTGISHCVILKDFLGHGDWDKPGKETQLVQGTG